MPDRVPDQDPCGSRAPPRRLVLLWRSYLPYHVARLRAAQQAFAAAGCEVLGLQATADPAGYEFLTAGPAACGLHTALPGRRLADCTRDEVFAKTHDAGRRGFTLEVRHSNDAALSLYEGMGFRRQGVRRGYYTDNREDAVIMWRDAADAS
jgi:hypothetical protein